MKKYSIFLLSLILILGLMVDQGLAGGFRHGGGGPTFAYMMPDLDEINMQITAMQIPKLDDGFFAYGGKGFGFVGGNFAIGGMGAGGSMSTSGFVPASGEIPGLVKEVDVELGYGGVFVEYAMNTPLKCQLLLGSLIGWGGMTVKIVQHESSLYWDGIWENYQGDTSGNYDYTIQMDNSLFILSPWVGLTRKVLPWMGLNLKAGYFYSKAADDKWEVAGSEVFQAPDIDLGHIYYELAILFGM